MIDDYIHENTPVEVAKLRALQDISSILESLGKNINDYGIVPFSINIDENKRLRRMVIEETTDLDIKKGCVCATSLNIEQQFAYDAIMEKVNSESSGVFFIDGLGGTGRTTHSRFKITLETIGEVSYSVSKQSSLGTLLKMFRLIIWDEAPMVNRFAVETVDKMLRDIIDCTLPFGGKVVVLGEDFRQVLPNVREKLVPTFCEYLLKIGDGTEQEHTCNCIKLLDSIILQFEDEITPLKSLINHVFPNIKAYVDNLHEMTNRVIFTPTNECVDHINKILLEQIPGLCNEIRLTCRKFEKNVILAEITSGEYCGKHPSHNSRDRSRDDDGFVVMAATATVVVVGDTVILVLI
ncbi:uncharacterized protein LOC111394233 [Olea europaea var. sylvestris]|uniref:uncharacterized protein LOC111394233 n=1 Tax=Olea europaea var. sylvestris TaxID=158386 RepID=UPI000C1CF55F|nr:uncharacterized protein LOC111394233 [Olea europaea var. sylvestris]